MREERISVHTETSGRTIDWKRSGRKMMSSVFRTDVNFTSRTAVYAISMYGVVEGMSCEGHSYPDRRG